MARSEQRKSGIVERCIEIFENQTLKCNYDACSDDDDYDIDDDYEVIEVLVSDSFGLRSCSFH